MIAISKLQGTSGVVAMALLLWHLLQ